MARGGEALDHQTAAVLALPAAKKQKLEVGVQPSQIKRSFWVYRAVGENTANAIGDGNHREKGPPIRKPRSNLHPALGRRAASETEDSIVASAECLLSLANDQTSSDFGWRTCSLSAGRSAGGSYLCSNETSTEITNLPLSQESVHLMDHDREPSRSDPPQAHQRIGKQPKRRPLEFPRKPSSKQKVCQESFLSSPSARSEPLSSFSEPFPTQTLKRSFQTLSASTGSKQNSAGQAIGRKQDVSKHFSGCLLPVKPASLPQLLMHPVPKRPCLQSKAETDTSAPAKLAVTPSLFGDSKQLPAAVQNGGLNMVPARRGVRCAASVEKEPVDCRVIVDTQESQVEGASRLKASKAAEPSKWKGDWQSELIDLDDDEEPQEASDSQRADSGGRAVAALAEGSQNGEGVQMERLYDFLGRPFRIYVPARLWGAGVKSTPEIQEQRERESRLVLSELGTMIGLKNARQYSPEFTLSKMADEKVINLTSFELADRFLTKVTKNQATREQLRAHLKDVTLPRLRDGTLDATPKEEELAPIPILELANMVIGMHPTMRSAFGDLGAPVDFDRQIVRETRALEQATLEIVVVGKPGSAKSLTCNRLVAPGSDGMDGPFHPVPESRDHGTAVPIFVWKTKRPGLTTLVIGRRKSQYVKLVERRYLVGGITEDQLKYQYKCERIQQGGAWQMVCSCPEDRLVLPSLEVAIPGVESVGSNPKDRARFYTSRIREGYTPAQQLMIEKIRLESNYWEGLEESWELGDMVGYKEQENEFSDIRAVTDDIVREGVKGVPIIVHCCGDRERSEEDGILLLKLGIYDGAPNTFPLIVCPERPTAEVTAEQIWQDNVIALAGGIRKPERLAAWKVLNVQHLIQQQEAIICHLHDALVGMQPGNALNGPKAQELLQKTNAKSAAKQAQSFCCETNCETCCEKLLEKPAENKCGRASDDQRNVEDSDGAQQELKDRLTTSFMRYRAGFLFSSISIWLNVAAGLLKRQTQPGTSPAGPSAASSFLVDQKLHTILRADKRDFLRQFLKTLAELKQRVEEDLEEAATQLVDQMLELIPPNSVESKETRLQAFRMVSTGAAKFGSDILVCLNKFFLSLVDRGCEDRIERQSALLERVHRVAAGGTQLQETDDAESPLLYFNRAARVYIESKSQSKKDGSTAMEAAARWGAAGSDRSGSMEPAYTIPQYVMETCLEAMRAALEKGDPDEIRHHFVSGVLDQFFGHSGRTRQPIVRRLLSWAEKDYSVCLNTASEESLQPLLREQLPLPGSKAKLAAIRAEVTKLAEEAQRHNVRMARNMTHRVAHEEQHLPKPLVKVRPSKRPDFELLPEVNFQGIEKVTVPGNEIALIDLRPEPWTPPPDTPDSMPSTSGRDSVPYRVTGKMRVGQELLPRIEAYGHVTKEAVQRVPLGAPKTAAWVVFHLSHLEPEKDQTSVRFDFHSDVQQCTSISFVVCKENEAALHRRLLYRVADPFLVTIPDDTSTAAYFAAAQIVYWRLFTLDREQGYGSYLLVQNNIDGVSEVSGRSLASKSTTIQRAATFLQQTVLQERQRSQRALLRDLSSREGLLQLSDLLLDDLLDRDIPPGEQLTRDQQRELTREFETTFSPDRNLQDFPGSDFQKLLAKCKGRRTRHWFLTCAQKLHPTLGVSIYMPRDQLHAYTRDVYPDNTFQPRTSVPSFFLLVDAHATRVISPLHVPGVQEEGDFNKRLLAFVRWCFKQLEAQGRRSLASPIFSWRNKTFVTRQMLDGLHDEQPIDDLDVTKVEQVWRQPPIPKTFPKPEGTITLDAKLPGTRQLRLLDTAVEGNGLAAAVSSILTAFGAVPAAPLRQQVGAFVKQNYKALNLPDVASVQAAKKWAEVHAKEGSGLELDFVYALAQAKSINITVAMVNAREQLRFYIARSEKARDPDVSYVFGFADGIYSPVGWRNSEENGAEQED